MAELASFCNMSHISDSLQHNSSYLSQECVVQMKQRRFLIIEDLRNCLPKKEASKEAFIIISHPSFISNPCALLNWFIDMTQLKEWFANSIIWLQKTIFIMLLQAWMCQFHCNCTEKSTENRQTLFHRIRKVSHTGLEWHEDEYTTEEM